MNEAAKEFQTDVLTEPGVPRPSILASSRWLFAGSLVSRPLQFLNNIILARVLGPANLGVLALANSAATTLAGTVALGLGDATNNVLAQNFRRSRTNATTVACFAIWLSVIFSASVFALLWVFRATWEAVIFPKQMPDLLIGFALVLGWLNLLASLFNNSFSGLHLFRDSALFATLQVVLILLCSIPLGMVFGAPGALGGYIIASAVSTGAIVFRLRRFSAELLSKPGWPGTAAVKGLISFAIPLWLWALLSGPLTTLCFALLAAQPNGPKELGVFNAANSLKVIMALLPALLGNVINPAILEEGGAHGNASAFHLLLERSFVALCLLILPLLIVMLFGSDIIFLLYGAKYEGAAKLFLPLATSAALLVFSLPVQYAMVAKKRLWWNLATGASQQITLYGFALWSVPFYLARGLAWSFLASQIVYFVIQLECGIHFKAVPGSFRAINYLFLVTIGCALAAACLLPQWLLWCLMIPISLAALVIILRSYSDVHEWIAAALPAPARSSWRWASGIIAG